MEVALARFFAPARRRLFPARHTISYYVTRLDSHTCPPRFLESQAQKDLTRRARQILTAAGAGPLTFRLGAGLLIQCEAFEKDGVG